MSKWEYTKVKRSSVEFREMDEVNRLGLEGWEMVAADTTSFVMKRRIESSATGILQPFVPMKRQPGRPRKKTAL